jgi:hypothetical protein
VASHPSGGLARDGVVTEISLGSLRCRARLFEAWAFNADGCRDTAVV